MRQEDLLFPASVTVVYGATRAFVPQEEPAAYTVTLVSLALPEHPGVTGRGGFTRVLRSSAIALYADDEALTPSNDDDLQALARRIATDFYRHLAGRAELTLSGVQPWKVSGLDDVVEWDHSGEHLVTRARPCSWLAGFDDVWHDLGGGSSCPPHYGGDTYIGGDLWFLNNNTWFVGGDTYDILIEDGDTFLLEDGDTFLNFEGGPHLTFVDITVNFTSNTTVNYLDVFVNYDGDTTVHYHDTTIIYDGDTTIHYGGDVILNFAGPTFNFTDVTVFNYGPDVDVFFGGPEFYFAGDNHWYINDGGEWHIHGPGDLFFGGDLDVHFGGDLFLVGGPTFWGDAFYADNITYLSGGYVEFCGWFGWCYYAVTLAGDEDDWVVPSEQSKVVLLVDPGGASRTITGMVAHGDLQYVVVVNDSNDPDDTLTLTDVDAASAAGNRFRLPRGEDVVLYGDEAAGLWKDPTLDHWRVLHLGKMPAVSVRKNSAGDTYNRRRLNFIEGTNVTITVADDDVDNEIDVTISAAGGDDEGVRTEGTLAAAGTNQGTAAAIVTDAVEVTGADGTKGVILESKVAALTVIWNHAAATLKVYPPSGQTIAGQAANAAQDVGPGGCAMFARITSGQWTFDVMGTVP